MCTICDSNAKGWGLAYIHGISQCSFSEVDKYIERPVSTTYTNLVVTRQKVGWLLSNLNSNSLQKDRGRSTKIMNAVILIIQCELSFCSELRLEDSRVRRLQYILFIYIFSYVLTDWTFQISATTTVLYLFFSSI